MTKITGCGLEPPERNVYDKLPDVGEFPLPLRLDPDAPNLGVLAIQQMRESGLAVIDFREGAERAIIDEAFVAVASLFNGRLAREEDAVKYYGGGMSGYRPQALEIRSNTYDSHDKNRTFNIGPAGAFIPNLSDIRREVTAIQRARGVIVDKMTTVLEALSLPCRPPLDEGTVLGANWYYEPVLEQQPTHCDGVPVTGVVSNGDGLEGRCEDGYRKVRADTTRLIIFGSGIFPELGEAFVHRVRSLQKRTTLVAFGAFPPGHPNTARIRPDLPALMRQTETSFTLNGKGADSNARSFYDYPTIEEHWSERDTPRFTLETKAS